mgnify:CR=1 FL=1|jgi:hypothetical protein
MQIVETLEPTQEQWEAEAERLEELIGLYKSLGPTGAFGAMAIVYVKQRYDEGERTERLYQAMKGCE